MLDDTNITFWCIAYDALIDNQSLAFVYILVCNTAEESKMWNRNSARFGRRLITIDRKVAGHKSELTTITAIVVNVDVGMAHDILNYPR